MPPKLVFTLSIVFAALKHLSSLAQLRVTVSIFYGPVPRGKDNFEK